MNHGSSSIEIKIVGTAHSCQKSALHSTKPNSKAKWQRRTQKANPVKAMQ
jgi:hypothetical protein